jgi:medium-chain acyl-[acyl-carrier-protein] hydrolase
MDFSIFKSPAFHKHEISVHSYDVDFNSRLSVFSLFNYFQEIAWEHAAILHFGLENLAEKNLFWVLSRVRVEIDRLPMWTEKITLITYPRGNDGLFAIRDYEIFDSKGIRIIAGSSSWLILDIKSRRPVRLSELDFPFITNDRCAIPVNASKVADVKKGPSQVNSLSVKTSDIDVNLHVNNTRYIEWAYNTFSLAHHKDNQIKVVEVNFLAEGKEDNNLNIEQYQLSEKENSVVIKRIDDNKELCRVYFEWR